MNVDWYKQKEMFEERGYLSIRDCVNPEFLEAALKNFSEEIDNAEQIRTTTRLKQLVPNLLVKEFKDMIHILNGSPRENVVVAEQHFLKHDSQIHSAHYDSTWEEFVLLIVLGVSQNNESKLQIFDTAPEMKADSGMWRRAFHSVRLYKKVDRLKPISIDTQTGDILFFRASCYMHRRTNPQGVLHYRLSGNSFGINHFWNTCEEMAERTYGNFGLPKPAPEWFDRLFEQADDENNMIYKQPFIKDFIVRGPSLRYRMKKCIERLFFNNIKNVIRIYEKIYEKTVSK